MAQSQVITTSMIALSNINEEDVREVERNPGEVDQATTRQAESNRKRVSVLFGSAILQLPIWGFAINFGVFQEYLSSNWILKGSHGVTGIIGTTSNGVMYLSMPFLFALFTRRWAHKRQMAALCGTALMCLSFFLSSLSTHVWHLVITQGVMAAFGCALIYSPTTLSLGEWFETHNRAVAYGVVLSCKNIVGSACPFLFRVLLDRYGFRTALKIWAAFATGTSIPAVLMTSTPPSSMSSTPRRTRKIPWSFLRHQSIYIYTTAIMLQSAGYGIPQTYLNTYARDITLLSQTSATLLLTIFNAPGIVASSFFGYLSDSKRFNLSATTVTFVSAMSSSLSALLFWGLTSQGSIALLILFSTTFGFFAGGYSATWGGVIKELEKEASHSNEAIDSGMLYGLLNGARGIGYVGGGLAAVPLLRVGSTGSSAGFGYGTTYGPLIIFTGVCSVFGGWGMLWKWKGMLC